MAQGQLADIASIRPFNIETCLFNTKTCRFNITIWRLYMGKIQHVRHGPFKIRRTQAFLEGPCIFYMHKIRHGDTAPLLKIDMATRPNMWVPI